MQILEGYSMDHRIIYTTYDEMQAELLRLHLVRHGVPCWLRSMRVGGYQGITFGPLGEVHLMTVAPYAEKGKRLIKQAEADGFLRHLEGQVEEA
ncbi:MAG: hypothetical protein HY278_10400 [candidate division NC10 bacterium]|nr:hypothetical protein [candidate division NC10 bacterium]